MPVFPQYIIEGPASLSMTLVVNEGDNFIVYIDDDSLIWLFSLGLDTVIRGLRLIESSLIRTVNMVLTLFRDSVFRVTSIAVTPYLPMPQYIYASPGPIQFGNPTPRALWLPPIFDKTLWMKIALFVGEVTKNSAIKAVSLARNALGLKRISSYFHKD